MSLRRWTILLIAGTTLILIGMTLAITTRTLTVHYETQERIGVYLNVKRVLGAIDQQLTFLENTSNDWAAWDDAYAYVQDQNPGFAVENLQPQTFQGLGIDLMVLLNSRSQVVFSGVSRSDQSLDSTLPSALQGHLNPGDPILSTSGESNTRRGLMLVNNQPMLIVVRPILKTDKSGPASGMLLIGRYLSSELINSISNILLLTINSVPVPAVQNDPQYAPALAYQPTESEPNYVSLTPDQVSGFAILKDLFGERMLIIRVDQYPTIYNNGLVVNNYLAISLVVAALAFSILLFFLIQFNVLDRISRLGKEVIEIGASGDIHKRLSIPHKDELSNLAATINHTLDALEKAIFQRQESEERFRTLVESMQDVVFTVEKENERVKVFARDLPKSQGEAPSTLRQPADLEENLNQQIESHRQLLGQTFEGHSTEFEWSSQVNGQANHYIATLSPIYSGQGAITSLVGVSKDITQQKQLEQDLRKHVHELGALYSMSQQLLNQVEIAATEQTICKLAIENLGMQAAWILTPSPDGGILLPAVCAGIDRSALSAIPIYPDAGVALHPAASAFTSMDIKIDTLPAPGTAIGLPPDEEMHGIVAVPLVNVNTVLAVLVLVLKNSNSIDADGLALIRAFMNLSSVAIQNALLFFQVINGRERLQAVSRRLVEVQEEERRRIALELHDEIGQVLTSLRFAIDLIKSTAPEKIESQVGSATEIVNDLIGRVRQISLDLRPSMLDDLGIVQTLLWFFDRFTRQTSIQVVFPPNNLGRRRFAPNIEITAYRIVQEALTNVARHAKVNQVTVRLWCNEKILGIQVEDQGVGFDVDSVFTTRNSKGLLGMWERVDYIGGQMDIVSEPGEGTSLTMELPLEGIIERRRLGR